MRVWVGFSTSSALISKLIRAITHADVSHAFFILDTDEVGALVYQSVSGGPQITTLAEFLKDNTIVRKHAPKIDVADAVKRSIARFVGYGYDFAADLSDGLTDIAHDAGLNWQADFAGQHASECAALVVRTLRLCVDPGYPEIDTLDPHHIEPGQLDQFMLAQEESC